MDNNNKGVQLKFEILDEGNDVTITEEEKQEIERLMEHEYFYFRRLLLDEATTAKLLSLPLEERMPFFDKVSKEFRDKNAEYSRFIDEEIYQDPLKALQFFKSLTPEDFDTANINAAATRYTHLQLTIKDVEATIKTTPVDVDELRTIWPILEMLKLFNDNELAALYYLKYPRTTPKQKAIEKGAIMTIGGRNKDISSRDWSGWLDEIPNDSAYISYVGPGYWQDIEIDEGGNIYEGDEARVLRAVRDQDEKVKKAFAAGSFGEGRPREHNRINKEVMRALLKATIEEKNGIRTIYLPTFAAELNRNYKIDVDEYDEHGNLTAEGIKNKEAAEERKKEAQESRNAGEKKYTNERPSIMQQFYSLDYWAGVLDRNDITRTAVIVGLNKEAQTIDIVLPYLEKIKQRVNEAKEIEAEKTHRQYLIEMYNDLVYSNIEAERNKLAVDLVYTIINKLLQRGTTPDNYLKRDPAKEEGAEDKKPPKTGGRVTYRAKYQTLVDDTPLLSMAYKNAGSADKKYKILTRTFSKAFQLLHKKTDIYEYFIDLKMPEVPPTIKTLDNVFVVTHNGKNPKYKK